jgi:hypothetical protein
MTIDGKFAWHWAHAGIYVLLVLMLNVIVIVFVFLMLFPATVAPLFSGSKWMVGIALFAVGVAHHYFLLYKTRYKKIVAEFSKESADEQRRGDLTFRWYLGTSMLLLIAVFVIAIVFVDSPGR